MLSDYSPTAKICIIAGISGSGKTTFAKNIASSCSNFYAIDASSFLTDDRKMNPLRAHNENQRQIILGVKKLQENLDGNRIILLTAHTVIEASGKLVQVDREIFESIEPSVILHLEEEPTEIARRRQFSEISESTLNINLIRNIQLASHQYAQEISLKLKIPFKQVSSSQDIGEILDLFGNVF